MTHSPFSADSLATFQPSDQAWDGFVAAQPGAHVLQLSAWGALKARFGWRSRIVALGRGGEIQAGALVLLKRLPLGLGEMAYIPKGPCARDPESLPALMRAIRRETGAAFLKIEPGTDWLDEVMSRRLGFQPSPQTIQPRSTIIIDISGDEAGILARMNQGARRKIRKSRRGDIVYASGGAADLPDFCQLMEETGARNNFGVHNAEYFEAAHELFSPRHGALLTARHEGELLAAIMVFALGESAWYLYGASSREKRNLYATYGIQWAAIEWARARGCRAYDLWGIPDCDEATLEAQFRERRDGLWGVYGFKRSWGGEIRRSPGAWDLPFNRVVYAAYRSALKLRG